MFKKNQREKEINELANFIVNNLSFGQSVNILIENARETAEYMLDNNCKIEDFNIYLDKEKRKDSKPMTKEKEGFFTKMRNLFFKKEKSTVEVIEETITEPKNRHKIKGPFSIPRKKKK
jgi:hypothetical protein